jgi:hypothetical protein
MSCDEIESLSVRLRVSKSMFSTVGLRAPEAARVCSISSGCAMVRWPNEVWEPGWTKSRLRFCAVAVSSHLILGTAQAPQPKPVELQDALHAHLHSCMPPDVPRSTARRSAGLTGSRGNDSGIVAVLLKARSLGSKQGLGAAGLNDSNRIGRGERIF